MPTNPFFEDAESAYFDTAGMPIQAGIYELLRYHGRKILYTLRFTEAEDGEPQHLKVVHASSLADYPYPSHA